jgi:hypothetical protein
MTGAGLRERDDSGPARIRMDDGQTQSRARPSATRGKDHGPGIIDHASELGLRPRPQLDNPSAGLTPQLIVQAVRDIAFHYLPRLAPGDTGDGHRASDMAGVLPPPHAPARGGEMRKAGGARIR